MFGDLGEKGVGVEGDIFAEKAHFSGLTQRAV